MSSRMKNIIIQLNCCPKRVGVDGCVNACWGIQSGTQTMSSGWGLGEHPDAVFPHIEVEPSFLPPFLEQCSRHSIRLHVCVIGRGMDCVWANGWGEVVKKRKLSTRDSYSPTILPSSNLYSQLSLLDRQTTHIDSSTAFLWSVLSCAWMDIFQVVLRKVE